MNSVLADIEGGDSGVPWWASFITPELVLILLVAAVVLILTCGVAGWLGYRRLRRNPRLRRQVLLLQAEYASPGLRRDVAALRLRLQEAIAGTQRVVTAAGSGPGPAGDLASLIRRISRIGAELDAELRLLAGEPDDAVLQTLLPPVRTRVEELLKVASTVRQGAIETQTGAAESELIGIAADAEQEVEALQSGVDALRQLSAGERAGGTTERSPLSRR
jgi:hypothetical protein